MWYNKQKQPAVILIVSLVVLLGGVVWYQRSHRAEPAAAALASLPEVEATQVAHLKDGDTFEMKAEKVKQTIGNRTIQRLAYNRQIPGPLIEVERGATITLVFTNLLDIPTTLHSHGVRLDNQFDGVPDSMGGAQKEIASGESFRYTLTFKDAGVYWYHPHMREDYTQEMGLYGNYAVEEAGYWAPADSEQYLVLDDFSENDPFYADVTNKTLMGRFGNLLLINNEEDYHLAVTQNKVTRLFLTNTANARPFLLTFPGAKVKLVGGDVGRIERDAWVDSIILAPAERAVVEVLYDTPGTYHILNRDKAFGAVTVTGSSDPAPAAFQELRSNTADYTSIRAHMAEWLQKAPDKKLRATIQMMGMQGNMGHMSATEEVHQEDATAGIEWEDTMQQMNAMSNTKNVTWQLVDEATGKVNEAMNSDWQFAQGDVVKVEIFNDPASVHPMQHPIHFHGQRFVVLSRNGVANDNLQWKDTALVRTGERVELLVEMSNPGFWLAHCHIAEHMHAGMMFGFTVGTPGAVRAMHVDEHPQKR